MFSIRSSCSRISGAFQEHPQLITNPICVWRFTSPTYDAAQHLLFKAQREPLRHNLWCANPSRMMCWLRLGREIRHHGIVQLNRRRPIGLLNRGIDKAQLAAMPIQFLCDL